MGSTDLFTILTRVLRFKPKKIVSWKQIRAKSGFLAFLTDWRQFPDSIRDSIILRDWRGACWPPSPFGSAHFHRYSKYYPFDPTIES
jgi:hypothetical protein